MTQKNKKGFTIWLTGLPCSGKTTIGRAIKKKLPSIKFIDGDELRSREQYPFKGFTKAERRKSQAYIRELCHGLNFIGKNCIVATISPYKMDRELVKKVLEKVIIVYIKCNIGECIKRDVKGMYQKALNKEIKNFTGISSTYEEPINPDLIIDTENLTVKKAVSLILTRVKEIK